MKKITINKGLIEGKERLKLHFEYDKEVISLLKTIPGARWNPKEKCWHVATQAGPVDKLNRLFEGKLHFEMDEKTIGREDVRTVGREDVRTVGREDDKMPSPARDASLVERKSDKPLSPLRDASLVEREPDKPLSPARDDSLVARSRYGTICFTSLRSAMFRYLTRTSRSMPSSFTMSRFWAAR